MPFNVGKEVSIKRIFLGILIGIGLLFGYYAYAWQNNERPSTFSKNDYSNFPYDLQNNVIYKTNPSETPPVRQVSIQSVSKQSEFCSCVIFARQQTGFTGKVGQAKYWPKTSKEPMVGGIVITSESRYGHVAVIRQITDGKLVLDEANYVTCQRTVGRELDINSPLVIGFWTSNDSKN